MTNEMKALIGIGLATLLILLGGVFLLSKSSTPTSNDPNQKVDQAILKGTDSYTIGSASASVSVVEFADFQCPACESAYPTVKRINEDYKDKIQYTFRHFPLPQHQNAKLAAYVAEAAGRQSPGKFWEMHDMLYENQSEWGESNKPMDFFVKYAKAIGLNVEKLKEDVKLDEISKKIDKDIQDAGMAGVNSTPTFYVNGRQFTGIPQYADLQKLIEEELQKAK